MTILQRIQEDTKIAMKAGEKDKVNALRFITAKLKDFTIYKNKELTEDDAVGIIASSIKSRQDSIDQFKKGNREDLVAAEERDIAFVKVYLPESLSAEELEKTIREAIAEAQAQGPKDTGKVMKILMPRVKGRADGKLVSDLVAKLLTPPAA